MTCLDDYVDRTPLTGKVFNADTSKLHLYIARLISENAFAEQKLPTLTDTADGRVDYFSLHEF